MKVTWFTDPAEGNFGEAPHKLSSYYQYDTETKELVRIRLELNRGESMRSTRNPAVFYERDCAIGFSPKSLSDMQQYPDDAFRIENGQLLVHGSPLDQTPSDHYFTVTMRMDKSYPHSGSVVTTRPNLPKGVEEHHLQTLAAKVLKVRKGFALTPHHVTAEALAREIIKIANKISETDKEIHAAITTPTLSSGEGQADALVALERETVGLSAPKVDQSTTVTATPTLPSHSEQKERDVSRPKGLRP
ncbi:MAG: hypothetical protein AAGB24_10765 [Bacteroidota bacterium]